MTVGLEPSLWPPRRVKLLRAAVDRAATLFNPAAERAAFMAADAAWARPPPPLAPPGISKSPL